MRGSFPARLFHENRTKGPFEVGAAPWPRHSYGHDTADGGKRRSQILSLHPESIKVRPAAPRRSCTCARSCRLTARSAHAARPAASGRGVFVGLRAILRQAAAPPFGATVVGRPTQLQSAAPPSPPARHGREGGRARCPALPFSASVALPGADRVQRPAATFSPNSAPHPRPASFLTLTPSRREGLAGRV